MRNLKEYKNLKRLSCKQRHTTSALSLVGLEMMVLSIYFSFLPGFSFDVSMTLLLLSTGFALLFFILWVGFTIRGRTSPGNLTPSQLQIVDSEIPTAPGCENLIVTSQALVSIKAGLVLLPLSDILWVYPYTITEKYNNLIPVWKHSTMTVCCRSGKQYRFNIKNSLNAYRFFRAELLKHKQDVIFGYDTELDVMFRENRRQMILLAQSDADNQRR